MLQLIAWLVFLIFLTLVLNSLRIALKPGLRSLPGPVPARFTQLYRFVKVAPGQSPEWYLALHKKYGPIVRTGPNTISISLPEAIPIVLGPNYKWLKSSFYDTMSPVYEGKVMRSMFTARDPEEHQSLKKPVSQKFSMTSIRSMEVYADECTKIFINQMRDLVGQPVDLGVWVQWYAFEVMGLMTFQRRFGFMEERRDIHEMIAGIDMVLKYAGAIGQIPSLHPYLMGNRYVPRLMAAISPSPDPLATIVKFTQECVADYDKSPQEQKDRPDFLAELRGGKPIPERDLINHLSNNLIAGSDTTGIALRAAFYYLMKSPSCLQKVVSEIDDADRAGMLSEYISYAECLELPYLQAVLKEAMRCCPSVSMPLERIVPPAGAEIHGTRLPAGTVVGINPVVLHNDTAVFGADAAEFRPERWTESSPEHIKLMERSLLTFGAGTRTCIGKNISIMEMGKFVPQILRHFDLEWASDQESWRVETYWFAKQHGIICRFKPRSKM